jgi:tetratricopeptide (TPR) repeat protein
MSSRLIARLSVALLVAVPMAAFGCINVYGTTAEGRQIDAESCSHDLARVIDPEHRKSREERNAEALALREQDAAADPSIANRNDLAAMAMRNGQFERAYNVLVAIEEEDPGAYRVAANLGTALELLGRNEEARRWIAEGIARNVDNHAGTEWLHLRILDAKLALARDPTWLNTHSVLGTDFGHDDAPAKRVTMPAGNDGQVIDAPLEVQFGICYQMMERLPFTPTPDPVVGSLLFDAGNIAYRHDTLDNAIKLYELAQTYTVADPELLARRLAHTRALLAKLGPKKGPVLRSK